MRKCGKFLLVLLTLASMFAGCGGLGDVKETTISISSKGAVTEVIMGDGKKQSYSAEELQSFVEEDIKVFNKNVKSDNVKLESCEIKDETPRIEIEYSSYEDYAAYHKTTLYFGTVKEAQSAGFDFKGEFADNNGETAAVSTILANDSDWHVAILEEPVNVRVSGDILYASKNAEITGSKEAKIVSEEDEGAITTESLAYLIYK